MKPIGPDNAISRENRMLVGIHSRFATKDCSLVIYVTKIVFAILSDQNNPMQPY